MKVMRKIFVLHFAVVLTVGLVVNFNACSEQSPIDPRESETKGETNSYPQYGSYTTTYREQKGDYIGGGINLDQGSRLKFENSALTPPEGMFRDPVTITMLVEKDETRNELLFSFGPSGCSFEPPAELQFNYKDLDSEYSKLFYIKESGEYVEQVPDDIDVQGKWLKLNIHHFSRYAVAWSN